MARVPYLDAEDMPEEYRYLLTKNTVGEANIFRALANNPPVMQSYMRYGSTLWDDTGLEKRGVEVVILAVATDMRADYEWHQHVRIARDAGLTDEEIVAIRDRDLDELAADEAALVEYATAIINREVDDALFEAVSEHHDDRTMVGVALLAGHYVMTAVMLEALDVQPREEFVGWDIEN
ncbi:MAG: carboxymuconolactone decarboxylase family protein [Haloarculaceae archaeon]